MTESTLKDKFRRLGPTNVIDQNQSGSPQILLLSPNSGIGNVEAIPAIKALFKRGMTMVRAKRAIETMIREGHTTALVPRVEDMEVLVDDLRRHGVSSNADVAIVP